MKVLLITLSFVMTFQASTFAGEPPKPESAKESVTFDQSHSLFTEVLKSYLIVSGPKSEVKYKALKKSPAQLNQYLRNLSSVSKKEYEGFNKKQKMAFLINAYNAFTLKLIIKHYPVKSIKDIGGLFSSPWKKEFFQLWGRDMYLDKIEHKILRKKFNEPRIHFAVNCASIGCPALRGEAFVADKLDAQLEEQAKMFLNDTSRNSYDVKKKKLKISKIFKWFDEDFEKNGSTVAKFVASYMSDEPEFRKKLEKFKIDYSDYNWKLNESR